MSKKTEAEAEFKATFERRLNLAVKTDTPVTWDEKLEVQEAAAKAATEEGTTPQPKGVREIKVFFMDESRFGLMTIERRRITLRGVKPTIRYQHAFENTYLYGAVEVATGRTFFLELPSLNTICFQLFVDYLAAEFPDSLNILVLDNASIHHAQQIVRPTQMRFVFTPPYTPEVNSMERVWEAFKFELAGEIFEDLCHLSDSLVDLVRSCVAEKLRSLTFFPYMRNAINAINTMI